MFIKNTNNNIKRFEINNKEFYKQYNNISITPFFIVMLNKYYEEKNMYDHLDFDEKIKFYIDKKFEYSYKKQYDNKISSLYQNGALIINDQKYQLKDFYIVYKNDLDYHLMCTDKNYHNEQIDYDKAIKFIDTSAFIELINNNQVIDNSIKINSIKDLLNIVYNWDGRLHDKTSNTDAIVNKNMIGINHDE